MIQPQRLFRPLQALLLAGALVLLNASGRSESSLEKTLKLYSKDEVKGYIQPIADLFGANMQAGWFHSAAIPTTGLNFTVSIVGMGAVVSDDQKSYSATSPFGGSYKTATVFGGQGGTATGPGGLQYQGSGGVINASLFPLASPQVRIGSIYGTEVALRWLPTVKAGDLGDISFFGIGVRHSISQYLMEFPVDLAAGFAYSKFSVGDLLDFKGLSIGAQASKKLALLTLYSGLAWEKTTLNLKYTPSPVGNAAVDIDLDGANNFRFTVGAGLDLFILTVFADATFGSVTNYSGGVAFGF